LPNLLLILHFMCQPSLLMSYLRKNFAVLNNSFFISILFCMKICKISKKYLYLHQNCEKGGAKPSFFACKFIP
jgi:hypothetical protein